LRWPQCARAQGLDVLCEAHDEPELQHALDAGCDLIGINSRNLQTLRSRSRNRIPQLAEKIPAACVSVAESGIHNGHDLARLRSAGYEAFLIGESLMKAEEHPGEALKKLMEEANPAVSKQPVLLRTDN
jgi:indole-3-glycerol phosphate synthase